ncbi:MAG: DUF465 domain-containing protein [Thermoanaerobaculaceae bacterium]|nr:DUF465 domain-containing protein [Thermoanaerobaculaceae bacterium]MDI9622483.1 DUF465 domain-containing protein [Acidobacteriota bacterium]NLH12525.1 DUF465 domain-containing protein [Holophagae bacterium]HPW55901.1 DUF465 domain-containing protein [Thermoanaerobaculaceae bacterium]
MSSTWDSRQELARQDPEFARLLQEHQNRERRIAALRAKGWLTTEEELEEKRLKKEKLRYKDQMEARLRKHSAQV